MKIKIINQPHLDEVVYDVLFKLDSYYIIYLGTSHIRQIPISETRIIDETPILMPRPYPLLDEYGNVLDDVYFDIGGGYHLQIGYNDKYDLVNYYHYVTGIPYYVIQNLKIIDNL